MIVIGITGTLGAGKGTVVEYLVEKYGFAHYSASGYLRELLEKEGIPIDRDAYNKKANELRAIDPQAVMKVLLGRAQHDEVERAIVESIHIVSDLDFVKEKGGFTLGVDADIKKRYERIQGRKSEKDSVTFEQFKTQQERESSSPDPAKSNLIACIQHADVVLHNNGSREELYAQVDEALKKFEIA